jgi:sugar phosphate isomerase/epimerase
VHAADAIRSRLGLQILFDFSDIVAAIEFAAANAFPVLELNLGNRHFAAQLENSHERARIRAAARRHKLTLAVHAIEGPSFFVPSRRVVDAGVTETKLLLNHCRDAGIAKVIKHLGFEMHYGQGAGYVYPHDFYPDFYRELVRDALAELKNHARGRARLCIENVGGFRYPFVREMLDRMLGGWLGLCYDIGHTNILKPEEKRAETEFFQRHRRHICHCHVHDNNGVRDEHLAPGKGRIDFVPPLLMLAGTGATLTFEVRPKEAALEARELFDRTIAPRLS